MILLLLAAVGIMAYVALNWGEHRMYRPGIARPLVIVAIILVAYVAWPLYGGFVMWVLPK